MVSGRERYRRRQLTALELVEAWVRDEDADVSNLADELARDPQGGCYALARIAATGLRLWTESARLEPEQALSALRAAVERELTDR